MIRPEAAETLRRWREPALAVGVTLIALWALGWPWLRWGWVSLALGLPVLLAGAVWLRVALRRALARRGATAGEVFVEERRVLYIGPLGNAQCDLDELERIDLAGGARASFLLAVPQAPPVSIPLGVTGIDALLDALSAQTGLPLEVFHRAAKADRGLVTIWRRPGAPGPSRLP